jgi:hypothetical protein
VVEFLMFAVVASVVMIVWAWWFDRYWSAKEELA